MTYGKQWWEAAKMLTKIVTVCHIVVELYVVILCCGIDAKAVYRSVYVNLKNQGIGSDSVTFIFPSWLKQLVRARFATRGLYDEQFLERHDAYHVLNKDFVCVKWDYPPDSCSFCQIKMPDTP